MTFLPMVGEPTGGWGPSSICTFKSFAKAQAAVTQLDQGVILKSELQHMCTALRRANARAVLCRSCDLSDMPMQTFSEAATLLTEEGAFGNAAAV